MTAPRFRVYFANSHGPDGKEYLDVDDATPYALQEGHNVLRVEELIPPHSSGASAITKESLERELADSVEHLRVLRLECTRMERIIESVKQLIDAKYSNVPSQTPASVMLFDALSSPGRQRFAEMSIRDAMRTVLREHHGPMKVRQIYEVLEANGKHIGGKSPTETVRAVLVRQKRLFKRTNGNWSLVE